MLTYAGHLEIYCVGDRKFTMNKEGTFQEVCLGKRMSIQEIKRIVEKDRENEEP